METLDRWYDKLEHSVGNGPIFFGIFFLIVFSALTAVLCPTLFKKGK